MSDRWRLGMNNPQLKAPNMVSHFKTLLKHDPEECGNELFRYFCITPKSDKERERVGEWYESLPKKQKKSLGD